jgi:hypothetical protein
MSSDIPKADIKEQLNALVAVCPHPEADNFGDDERDKAFYALGWLELACRVLDMTIDEVIDEYL